MNTSIQSLLIAALAVGLLRCGGPNSSADGAVPSDGGACPSQSEAVWGAGTTHEAAIASDERWTAAASPHRVTRRLTVTATLTVEPCAVVLIGGGASGAELDFQGAGRLVAEGAASSPILFRGVPDSDGVNRAAGLRASNATGPVIRLAHVTLERGGNYDSATGDYLVTMAGAGFSAEQTLHVDNVTLRDSYGGGIYLSSTAQFSTTSTALSVTRTKNGDGVSAEAAMPRASPVHFSNANFVGTLPSGDYTGNETDHVAIGEFGTNGADVTQSTTWTHRGVPYFVRTGLLVVPSMANTTLRLEAGVTLRFPAGSGSAHRGYLDVGRGVPSAERATLIVAGTAQSKVTLEAVTDTPGAWSGVEIFENGRDSRLEHLVLRHTGLESSQALKDCSALGNRFAIAINYRSSPGLEPPSPMLRNCTIRDALPTSVGINRGWYVLTPDGDSVSFLSAGSNNTVLGLSCRQSGFSRSPPGMRESCASMCE